MTAAAHDGVLQQRFEAILARDLDRVRRAMVARFGAEVGREATADAVAWAWAHAEQLVEAANPSGLLYRVAQSKARPHQRWASRRSRFELVPERAVAERDPGLVDLFRALDRLSQPQRVAVVLVHAHGERYEDVAELLGTSVAAVTNHVHRGLRRLRRILGDPS